MGAGEGGAPSGHDRSSHDRARGGVTSSAPIARVWTAGILTRAWAPLAPDDYLRAGADWHWLRSVTRFHGPASRGPPPMGGSIVGYRIPATIHRAPWTIRPRRPAKAASACLPPAASQTRRGGRPSLGPGVTAPWKGTPGCAGGADC